MLLFLFRFQKGNFAKKHKAADTAKDDDEDAGENDSDNEPEDKDEGEESPSFYVADDEKSIAIVDLLLESKDKR